LALKVVNYTLRQAGLRSDGLGMLIAVSRTSPGLLSCASHQITVEIRNQQDIIRKENGSRSASFVSWNNIFWMDYSADV
jgi:hypothetical protein